MLTVDDVHGSTDSPESDCAPQIAAYFLTARLGADVCEGVPVPDDEPPPAANDHVNHVFGWLTWSLALRHAFGPRGRAAHRHCATRSAHAAEPRIGTAPRHQVVRHVPGRG
ncbi:hypothetical protein GCM10027569_59990 [Flindersiella endophytica]